MVPAFPARIPVRIRSAVRTHVPTAAERVWARCITGRLSSRCPQRPVLRVCAPAHQAVLLTNSLVDKTVVANKSADKKSDEETTKEKTMKKISTKKTIKEVENRQDAATQVFHNYVQAVGPAAAATSKIKSEEMKKTSVTKKKSVADDFLIKVGHRIAGRWYNDDGTKG